MASFERDGFQMNYEVHPGLVPMDTIFMHGNLAGNVWWAPAVDLWKSQKAEREKKTGSPLKGSLILAEWRGCGQSSGPRTEDDLRMEVLSEDYIQLLKHLGVQKANIVAHSTGGLVALYALRKNPELFARVVLLDSVSASGAQLSPELLAAMKEMSKNRELCSIVMGSTIHQNDASSPLFQKIVDTAFGVHPLIWEGVLRVLSKINYWEEVAKIQHPTLVLHGEHDAVLPMADSERLAKTLPNGTFQQLDGQGHSCNVENPKRFVETANRFLFG